MKKRWKMAHRAKDVAVCIISSSGAYLGPTKEKNKLYYAITAGSRSRHGSCDRG